MDHKPPKHEDYRVLTPRRRVLILLLAIATAITVVMVLLYPPGGVQRTRPPCVEDQTTRCVGGKADVIFVPAPDVAASTAGR